jgi:hypothetical protein
VIDLRVYPNIHQMILSRSFYFPLPSFKKGSAFSIRSKKELKNVPLFYTITQSLTTGAWIFPYKQTITHPGRYTTFPQAYLRLADKYKPLFIDIKTENYYYRIRRKLSLF